MLCIILFSKNVQPFLLYLEFLNQTKWFIFQKRCIAFDGSMLETLSDLEGEIYFFTVDVQVGFHLIC